MFGMRKPNTRRPGRPANREIVSRVQRLHNEQLRRQLTQRESRSGRRKPPLSKNERSAISRLARQKNARWRALYLKAQGHWLRKIANDPLMVRALGHAVSGRRVQQLIRSSPPSPSDRWIEDVEEVMRTWCVHLRTGDTTDRNFWIEVIAPRLFARGVMGEPEWVNRQRPLDDSEASAMPESGSVREWRRDIRDRFVRHLFATRSPSAPVIESGNEVKNLARKFGVSPRTVCRILRDSAARPRRRRENISGATKG